MPDGRKSDRLLENSIQGHDRADLMNAALAAIPEGAARLARKAERDAAITATNAMAAAWRQAEWEAGQPARVLAAIEAAGTTLSLGKPKGIAATGSEIGDELMASLLAYRPGIESILAARQAANAPRLIA